MGTNITLETVLEIGQMLYFARGSIAIKRAFCKTCSGEGYLDASILNDTKIVRIACPTCAGRGGKNYTIPYYTLQHARIISFGIRASNRWRAVLSDKTTVWLDNLQSLSDASQWYTRKEDAEAQLKRLATNTETEVARLSSDFPDYDWS